MLEARARHYGDLMNKIKGYEDKNQMLEIQKIKNTLDQKQRKQGIQNNREQWMMGNHNTKKDLESLADMLKDAKNQNDEADMGYKKQVWRSIMS
jgi:predicted patatin/cPLA2 family phospholipase